MVINLKRKLKIPSGKQKGFQIASVNINGLNSQNKQGRIFKQLIKLKADITCIQETHLKEGDQRFLSCPRLGKLFMHQM